MIDPATDARLARIEAMLMTLVERTAPKPKREVVSPHAEKVDAFVDAWNRVRGGLSAASRAKPGTKRHRDILACLLLEPDLGRWERAMIALASSRFHRGENERGWTASIDFLIQPKQRQVWLDRAAPEYQPPTATVPRIAACHACGAQATVGPGTRQPELSQQPMCPGCFGG